MKPFAVVLLAAGGSRRMGRSKALLPYLGRTLVEHAARTALASGAAEVIVVLGCEAEAVRAKLRGIPVRIVVNRAWEEGMASSIRAGIAALSPEAQRAVIALGDQPRITPGHLRALAEELARAPVVASTYDGVLGAPCAFARAEFGRLSMLAGDGGARHLVRSGEEPVATIEFAAANTDVDTPEAYAALIAAPATADGDEPEAGGDGSRAPPEEGATPLP